MRNFWIFLGHILTVPLTKNNYLPIEGYFIPAGYFVTLPLFLFNGDFLKAILFSPPSPPSLKGTVPQKSE
jgi:hypothetical protein